MDKELTLKTLIEGGRDKELFIKGTSKKNKIK